MSLGRRQNRAFSFLQSQFSLSFSLSRQFFQVSQTVEFGAQAVRKMLIANGLFSAAVAELQ